MVCFFAAIRHAARYAPLYGKETATKTLLGLKSQYIYIGSLPSALTQSVKKQKTGDKQPGHSQQHKAAARLAVAA